MSIIIKINKFINSFISINLTAMCTYIFSIIVFKFYILTTFFTYHSTFLNLFTTNGYMINFLFFWEYHAIKKLKGTKLCWDVWNRICAETYQNRFWFHTTQNLCSIKRDCAKFKYSLTRSLSLFALWLVKIMLIFTRLCQSTPHQVRFARLVYFLMRTFFYLICQSRLHFYERFLCDIVGWITTLVHFFNCAKWPPWKCIFLCFGSCCLFVGKMARVFSMTAPVVRQFTRRLRLPWN